MGQREDLRSYLKRRNCTGASGGWVKYANGESETIGDLMSKFKLGPEEIRSIANSM